LKEYQVLARTGTTKVIVFGQYVFKARCGMSLDERYQSLEGIMLELCAKLGDGHVREAAYRGG
jgi:hypothetical protein